MNNTKRFKKLVNLIEIETFSYCNRQCWHCPNSIIDRNSKNIFMNTHIYNKIIKDLKKINYDKLVTYSRYNEPLANDIIYKRLNYAKTNLPNATLHFNTNGDFLTIDKLHRLYDSGLRSLNIQIYTNKREKVLKMISDKLTELKLNPDEHKINDVLIQESTNFNDMEILIYYRDFKNVGSNRGGILKILNKPPQRITPCFIPTNGIYIDYNGSVMPCCNLRSDWKEHEQFILGKLTNKNETIFSIFNNKKANKFRKLVSKNSKKPYPCNSCHFLERKCE